MDEEEFRLMIEDYRLDCQFPMQLFRNLDKCEKASWTNWALDELTEYVHRFPGVDILKAVTDFGKLMRLYMRKYPQTLRMFFVAVYVADDIADILRCSLNSRNELD